MNMKRNLLNNWTNTYLMIKELKEWLLETGLPRQFEIEMKIKN